jgi:hypothetical protein
VILSATWSPEAVIALLGLFVTTLSGVIAWWANGVRVERARLQKLYADAYAAVVSYQEFPFMIRRRRAPLPGQQQIANDERIRIADALQAVQQQLSNYTAQISTESIDVSTKYEALVEKTRLIAGTYMHKAWEGPPLDNDAGMNISDIDHGQLKQPQDEYLTAIKHDLHFWRVACVWCRAG